MTGSAQRSKPSRPPVSWSWLNAAHGAVLAIPAVVACVFDPAIGLPLAVGVLPAAALGLRRPRRQRFLVVIVGALAGVSMIIGSLVAPFPMIAVLTVFALCVVVAVLMVNPRRRFAPLALMLVQVDGSRHDWLEGRGPWLTLHAAIDDASSEVVGAVFREEEDATGYAGSVRNCV